ncbi:hypothetical protein ACTXKY_03040 [Corynebacterium variabile]|uniref:hypothetical protein n=1 Tax=Corynebacterium variabile TaxID=1727 RepID=UPI003F918B92
MRFRSYGLSGVAQGLNFLAMLLPVLGRQTEQLTYLVVPLALASLFSRAATFAFPGRYLAIPDRLTRTATSAAFLGLLGCTGLFLVASACAAGAGYGYWAGIFAWSALLAVTHGLYFTAVAVVSREQRMDVYSRARFVYGIINISGTALVVFAVPFREGLIVVAALITLSGAVLMLASAHNRVVPVFVAELPRLLDRRHRAYMRGSLRASGAQLLTDLAFQIQALATPFLGQYQDMWAVALRLTGGFSGLSQQVIAPGFEMRIAAAVRSGNHTTVRQWVLRGLFGGVAIAGFSAVVVVGAVLFSTGTDLPWWTVFSIGVFSGGSLLTSLVIKVPYITGHDTRYLVWSVIRPGLLCASLLLPAGPLLIAIAATQIISAATFLPLLLLPPIDRFSDTPTPVDDANGAAPDSSTTGDRHTERNLS